MEAVTAKLIPRATPCVHVEARAGGGGPGLTVRERILVHLGECGADPDVYLAPLKVTQAGVAIAVGIERRHVPQYVRALIRDGLVTERSSRVTGSHQRRKVYFLTHVGRMESVRLREWAKAMTVRVRDGDAIREVTVAHLLEGGGKRISVLDVARRAAREGVLEMASLGRSSSSLFVEQTTEAPRLGTFVGRREELGEVLRESEGPRVFVVRGVAGIGKSSFGAKVCELSEGRRNLFWHRVRSWDSSLTVLSSLGRFLSALDRPGLSSVLSRGEVARASEVLRQDLSGVQSLLVLDDAHEATPEVLPVFRMLMEAVAAAPDARLLILTRRALPVYSRQDVAVEGRVREIELLGLGSEDSVALLSRGAELSDLAGLGRRLRGHPLLLELVRVHRPQTSKGLLDVRRFIQEEIYRKLSDPQRTIMKVGSLYRVPVPREALLAGPGGSYDALASLEEQSLVRPAGEDRDEIHDTIRDFFAGILTPEERRRYGAIAVAQLRKLASEASASGHWVPCVAYLSNALQMSEPREDRGELYESLGDANQPIGDVLSVSAAYREAMAVTKDPETTARLHRKLASALEARGQLDAASLEVDAGLATLVDADSIERGWLDLVRAWIADEDYDRPAAERYAESALAIFERHGNLHGRAQALLVAGRAATWTGTTTANGSSLATRRFESALELAGRLNDPVLTTRIHIAMAIAIGYGSGDYEEGMKHWRAAESSPGATADLTVCALMHLERAWFMLRVKEDFVAADSDLSEAEHIARKIRDTRVLADVKYQQGAMAGQRGRHADAARLLEEAAVEMERAGITGFAANAFWGATWSYLAIGDWEGYHRAASALRNPELEQAAQRNSVQWLCHRGFESLLDGRAEDFERDFGRILRYARQMPAQSLSHEADLWKAHFCYSVGLRALGRERDAERERRRALEIVRAANNRQAARNIEGDLGDRMAQTLREGMKLT